MYSLYVVDFFPRHKTRLTFVFSVEGKQMSRCVSFDSIAWGPEVAGWLKGEGGECWMGKG